MAFDTTILFEFPALVAQASNRLAAQPWLVVLVVVLLLGLVFTLLLRVLEDLMRFVALAWREQTSAGKQERRRMLDAIRVETEAAMAPLPASLSLPSPTSPSGQTRPVWPVWLAWLGRVSALAWALGAAAMSKRLLLDAQAAAWLAACQACPVSLNAASPGALTALAAFAALHAVAALFLMWPSTWTRGLVQRWPFLGIRVWGTQKP